ncbi:hypothetical protein ABFV58_33935, partial [Pseudomonas protegens]|uniref:hypothetical protein n=1 Tax=Pseudomonas protegens TaxID=380021 RepID=UPI0034D5220A
ALLALFSVDDEPFTKYKTGNWFNEHQYRARVNVSAVILPTTNYIDYEYLFEQTKQFGEPGLAFLDNEDYAYNPCFEVGMYPQIN